LWRGIRLRCRDRRTGLRRLRWLRFGLRLTANISDLLDRGDHLSLLFPSLGASFGASSAPASDQRRASTRSSCALDMFERPSIPRSFASS
jgi:hypothetical protein